MSSSQDCVTADSQAGIGPRLLAAYDRLLQAFGGISALGLLAIPVLVSLDVITRHAGGWNIIWLADVCEYILFAATLIGAPWLLHLGRHVRIDVLPGLLRGQAARRLEQAINALMLAICLLLVAHAFEALSQALKYQTMLYKALSLPVWPFIAIFITSFSLICLELIVRLCTGRSGTEDKHVSV